MQYVFGLLILKIRNKALSLRWMKIFKLTWDMVFKIIVWLSLFNQHFDNLNCSGMRLNFSDWIYFTGVLCSKSPYEWTWVEITISVRVVKTTVIGHCSRCKQMSNQLLRVAISAKIQISTIIDLPFAQYLCFKTFTNDWLPKRQLPTSFLIYKEISACP